LRHFCGGAATDFPARLLRRIMQEYPDFPFGNVIPKNRLSFLKPSLFVSLQQILMVFFKRIKIPYLLKS
jgi:hypothetical protein